MNRLAHWTLALALAATSLTQAQTPKPAAPPTPAAEPGNDIGDLNAATPAPARRPQRPNIQFDPSVKIPDGPAKLDWNSIKANFKTPSWMDQSKFGIFIHWGLYSVAAHHNEWYAKHMYGNGGIIKWHQENFGPQDKFGYKDFIPLFKAEKFNPDQWAELFKKSGAKYVIPTAEHHDHFAMWDSDITKWCAGKMGPKRDLIGDLGKAVRAQGLKYGVSNHRMYGYDFIQPADGLKTDLYDPAYADFYGPPGPKGSLPDQKYCNDWLARNIELIEKYKPDFMWFDWDGAGETNPVKLQFAAYYLNRAAEWGKEVAFSQKGNTFPVGTGISSSEKGSRIPKEIQRNLFEVDDVISDRSWGYTSDMKYRSATSIVVELAEAVSKNGTLMLNISPKGDGSIPDEQQQILLSIGKWLDLNGEAIYATKPFTTPNDGAAIKYTTKPGTLYAILTKWSDKTALPSVLESKLGKIESVELIGSKSPVKFEATSTGLNVDLPSEKPCDHAWVLKIKASNLK